MPGKFFNVTAGTPISPANNGNRTPLFTTRRIPVSAAVLGAVVWLRGQPKAETTIHFTYRPVGFTLDSCETPDRHAPETMASGVGVLDFDNDGDLDVFFANGADIRTPTKTSPKYANRLFANDG